MRHPRCRAAVAVPAPHAPPQDDASSGRGGPVTVTPDTPPASVRTGLSGEAEVVLGGHDVTMRLADCALSRGHGSGLLVRGDGPDGRLAVTPAGELGGGVVVAVEAADGPSGTYTGTQREMSGRGRDGLLRERHRFTLEGQVRDVHSGEEVTVELVVTCDAG